MKLIADGRCDHDQGLLLKHSSRSVGPRASGATSVDLRLVNASPKASVRATLRIPAMAAQTVVQPFEAKVREVRCVGNAVSFRAMKPKGRDLRRPGVRWALTLEAAQ
jgi:hypothetical protein